jgi:hypothetical protein
MLASFITLFLNPKSSVASPSRTAEAEAHKHNLVIGYLIPRHRSRFFPLFASELRVPHSP